MKLFLMRHAQASPLYGGYTDENRPLTPEGQDQAFQMAGELKRRQVTLDAIVSSPFVRAHQTARIVAESLGTQRLELSALLASRGARPPIEPFLEKFSAEASLLFVGHQPDMGMLAAALCGASVPFSVATIAAFEWNPPDDAQLLWTLAPADLPAG